MKKECKDCNGTGLIEVGCCELCHHIEKCETCNGTGEVEHIIKQYEVKE